MPFITLPDIKGKIYVPEQDALSLKKHPCGNCFSCQRCSDDRCGLCLAQSTVSQHLKSLKESGLVKGEIEGPRTCYCLDRTVMDLFKYKANDL
jgi:hypothetical protein